LIESINKIIGRDVKPMYAEPRLGEVKHSLANISKAQQMLGYSVKVAFEDGLNKIISDSE
jgi:UDP-glucose 4-epimerase